MQQGGPARPVYRCIVAYAVTHLLTKLCRDFVILWLDFLMPNLPRTFFLCTRATVSVALLATFGIFYQPPLQADSAKSLEDYAQVYVNQYFEPDERHLLSEEGRKKSSALANYALGRSLETMGRPMDAVDAYKSVLENQPDRYFLARKTAYLLAKAGQQGEALSVLEENLERNQDEPFAYISLSEFLNTYRSDDPASQQRAFDIAEEAVAKFPKRAVTYGHLVKIYMASGRRDDAAKVVEKAAEIDSTDPYYWTAIGKIAGAIWPPGSSGNAKLVNAIYAQALGHAGDKWDVIERVGDYYHATTQFDRAIHAYSTVIAAAPDNLPLREKLARVYGGKGDNEKVIETLKEIVEIDPENARSHKQIASIYLRLKKYPEAIPHLRKSLEITQGSVEEYGALGKMMIDLKEFENAKEFLDDAAYLFPEAPVFPYLNAAAASSQQNWADAVKYYELTLPLAEKSQPELLNEGFYFQFAAANERNGDLKTAEKLFRKSMELIAKNDPDDENREFTAQVYNYLGYMWLENNLNIDEAGELIKTAVDLDPNSGAIADSLGWYYFVKGNYPAAKDELLRAERLMDADPRFAENPDGVIYDHIAQAHYVLGEREKAIEYMEKAIKYSPDEEEFAARLREYQNSPEKKVTKEQDKPENEEKPVLEGAASP